MVMKKGEFMKQILMCLPEIFSGQKNLSKVINWLRKRGIHETDIYVSTKVGIWMHLKLMIFSKIILVLILKGKRAVPVPVQLYIFNFVVREFCIRESPVEWASARWLNHWGEGCPGCPLVTPKSYCPAGALVNFFWHLSGIYSKAMVVFRYNLVYWHLIFCKYITSVVWKLKGGCVPCLQSNLCSEMFLQ